MSGDQHSSVHRPESWFVAASGAEVESSAPPVPGLTAAAKNDQRWAGEAAETEREQQQEPTQAGTRKWLRAVKGELTPPQSGCVSWRGEVRAAALPHSRVYSGSIFSSVCARTECPLSAGETPAAPSYGERSVRTAVAAEAWPSVLRSFRRPRRRDETLRDTFDAVMVGAGNGLSRSRRCQVT